MIKNKIAFILCLVMIMTLHSGENNPTAMGSSFTNALLLKGIDAVRYNPATLGFSDNYKGSINFFPISFALDNSFSTSTYMEYIDQSGDNMWSIDDRNNIVDQMGDEWRLRNSLNLDVAGFSSGNKAFTLNVQSIQDFTFPKKLVELILHGNEMGVEYSFNDFDAEAMNIASLGFSFAKLVELDGVNEVFKELSIGATIRYIYAIPTVPMTDLDETSDEELLVAYYKIQNVNAYFDTDDLTDSTSTAQGATTLKGEFDLLTSDGGQGIGVDLGIAAKINKKMNLGLSVKNALAGISWYKNNRIYRFDYEIDGILISNIDDFEADADTMYTIKDVAETRKFFTILPPEMRLDFTWEFHPGNQKLIWTNSYIQGFRDELLSTTTPIFSTGFQWNHKKSDWFIFRAGITGGGEALYSSAAGFSLAFSHYSFDIAIENKYFYFESSKGIGVAIGQKFYW